MLAHVPPLSEIVGATYFHCGPNWPGQPKRLVPPPPHPGQSLSYSTICCPPPPCSLANIPGNVILGLPEHVQQDPRLQQMWPHLRCIEEDGGHLSQPGNGESENSVAGVHRLLAVEHHIIQVDGRHVKFKVCHLVRESLQSCYRMMDPKNMKQKTWLAITPSAYTASLAVGGCNEDDSRWHMEEAGNGPTNSNIFR